MELLNRACCFMMLFANILYAQQCIDVTAECNRMMALAPKDREVHMRHFFATHQQHPDPLALAYCYHEYSKKAYRTAIDPAITLIDQAIAIRLAHNDHRGAAQSLYAKAYYYNLKGNYPKSIRLYTQLLALSQDPNLKAKTHNRMGVMYTKIGDFDQAGIHFEIVERYCKQQNKRKLLLKNHIDFSKLFSTKSWKNHHQIAYHLQQADSLITVVNANDQNRLIVRQMFGNLYDATHAFDQAILHHQRALAISMRMQDSAYIAMNYNNIGISYRKSGAYQKAFEYYQQAMAYAANEVAIQAMVYNNLGDYYVSKEAYPEAMVAYHKAIVYTLQKTDTLDDTTLPTIETFIMSPYKLDVLGYLTDKAHAWLAYYAHDPQEKYLEWALETFRVADRLVDEIRLESTEFQSKLFWRAQSAALYMKAVQACYQLGKPEEAYYFIEKNKAILLLEDLVQQQATVNAGIPTSLSDRAFELKRNIHLSETQLHRETAKSNQTIDSLKSVVYERKRIYKQFIDSLVIRYPVYYTSTQQLPLVSFDTMLSDVTATEEVTIYYMLNAAEGYGLLVTAEGPQLFKIHHVPELQKNIAQLQQQLVSPLYTTSELAAYKKTAHTILTTILPEKAIASLHDKNLRIIPDGSLQQLPFEVLTTSASLDAKYLLQHCDISYAYSSSFLALNEKVIRTPTDDFIGFAPVSFKDTTLVNLSRSLTETTEIASLFTGDVYQKEQASKHHLMTTATQYKVIHLSTHAGIGDKTSPWIALHDDRIYLEELYHTRNQAELVVLSACNTSKGALKTGEGVMSLARGFFSSGTRSVVSTLWSVNEKSTNEIITEFYQRLQKGETKISALQAAKRRYIQRHHGVEAAPYYWGALILIGNTDAMVFKKQSLLKWGIGIGVLVVMLVVLAIKRFTLF